MASCMDLIWLVLISIFVAMSFPNSPPSIQRRRYRSCRTEQSVTEGSHRPNRHTADQADDQRIFDNGNPALIAGKAAHERPHELRLSKHAGRSGDRVGDIA